MKVRTIVVGYDGSSDARRALDTATDLVSEDGTVHVVTAFHPPSAGEVAQLIDSLPDEFKNSYDVLEVPRSHLQDAARLLEARAIDHKTHFVDDHPAAAILDTADEVDADLIIVGSRGLGRVTRYIRGSVSTRVASHARKSFMVIHSEDAAE